MCVVKKCIKQRTTHYLGKRIFIHLIKRTNYGAEIKKYDECGMLFRTIGVTDFQISNKTINGGIETLRSRSYGNFAMTTT